jgi:hypothetical protein
MTRRQYVIRRVAVVLVFTVMWHLSVFQDPHDLWPLTRHAPLADGTRLYTRATEEASLSTPAAEDVRLSALVGGDAQLPCESLHGFGDIFLIVRTGASEAGVKLPAHLNTTLRCLPPNSYGIWSDLEEDINGHHVGNALDEMDPDIIANDPDFAYYRRLQEEGLAGFSADERDSWAAAPNSAGGRDTPGWKLDKWKFLPLADKAYRQRPDAKWYIFMECDGYINWSNMLYRLSQIDPSQRHYLGQLMMIGDVAFAYGGASFAISNSAMKAVVEHRAARPGFYEDFTSHHWAGDCILGKALIDAGVELSQSWPNFFGDSPFDMDYSARVGGPDSRTWCYVAMSWHHLSPPEIEEVSAFEQRWNLEVRLTLLSVDRARLDITDCYQHSKHLRHSDVFRHLVLPKLGPKVEDWENLSSDDERSKESFEDCRSDCENRPSCIQFVFYHESQICKTSNKVTLGYQQKRDATCDKRATSGWVMDRVYGFVGDMEASCHGEDWVLS